MVKPSKLMQPEHVDLQQASKRIGKGAAFGEDSFRNYMALKIAIQRQQFGLILPPPPPSVSSERNSHPSSSRARPTSQELEGVKLAHEINSKTCSSFSAPTKPQLRPDSANRSKEQTTERIPTSKSLSHSLRKAKYTSSNASTTCERPTLSERSLLAPSNVQRAYPMVGGSSIRTNRAISNTTNRVCAPSDRSVRFAEDICQESATTKGETKTKKSKTKTKMESLVNRLKKRHGRGNQRLEGSDGSRRKSEEYFDQNIVEGDKAINAKIHLSIKPVEQNDGLAELESLFSMADENDSNTRFNNDARNDEHGSCKRRGKALTVMATEPDASNFSKGDGNSAPTVDDGLAELEKIFATTGSANDDSTPLSPDHYEPGDGNCDILEEQQDREQDKVISKTRAGNGDNPLLFFDNDGFGKSNQDISNLQQVGELKPDKMILTAVNDDSNSIVDDEESGEAKHAILEQQQASNKMAPVALNSQAYEDGMELSTPTAVTPSAPPSPKSIRKLRPDLFFYGVVVKIAGYTHPDNETIKRLLQKHGGDLETYETERVTHIIAQQLSMAKANVYKKARRPRPVCRPSWIVDSVREGKLLPHGKYLLIEERDQQQMGIQSMLHHTTARDRQQHQKTSTALSSPQKSLMVCNNPYAKRGKMLQSPEKRHENKYSSEETSRRSLVGHAHDINIGILKNPNGKVRTVSTDPNFLDSYFASSRLSFIGSFKQRASSTSNSNDARQLPPVFHSKKLIFHVDMDCFFASVVLRNYPQYKDKPVVISHHGSRSINQRKDESRGNNCNTSLGHVPKNSSSECATCNYEARKYGIKKGMFLGQAKDLCPELIVLMYDFDGYEEVSQQVLEILDRLASSDNHRGAVETVSCDEAYVELNFNALEESEKLRAHAYQIAESIRSQIFDTTRCTASVGIGPNKFLAKLGTDKAKPNKSYFVRDYLEVLKGLKLRDVHGVGRRTEKKLIEEGLVTVQDVWDLGSRGERELIRILGPGNGKRIYDYTQGKDDRPVTPVERKTIGAECNYGVRFDGPYGIDHFMKGLAKEVEKRMERTSMKGKKLTLKIKQRKKGASNKHKFLGHGSCHNLSKSIDIPGNVPTRDAKLFTKIGLNLFREFGIGDIHEVRGMGITISTLVSDNNTGKQKNASSMQHWLHQRNDLELKHSLTIEKANGGIVEGSTENNDDPLSIPNSRERLTTDNEGIVMEKSVRNEESPFKIELPPMSQIQMSQVEALPPEYRHHVLSRMKAANVDNIKEYRSEGNIDQENVKERSIEAVGVSKKFDGEESPTTNKILLPTTKVDGILLNEEEQDNDTETLEIRESPLLIELPPMSQIHLTQVEALPPYLQQQIYSRMNHQLTTHAAVEGIADVRNEAQHVNQALTKEQYVECKQPSSLNRFRQTDLKRMMKLAAVRSGHESTNISLTQLEELPLEIKLQVVNRDHEELGMLSQHVSRPAIANHRPQRKSTSNTAKIVVGSMASKPKRTVSNDTNNAGERKKKRYSTDVLNSTTVVKNNSVAPKPRQEFHIIDRVDVWKEDLLPLKEFLNENCPLRYPKSIDMVLEFLSIILKEGRLPAMVIMFRCIRNRHDEWSKIEVIGKIAGAINDLHIKRFGASLDVSWLMGSKE